MASEVAQKIIRETCREHGATVDEAFVELKRTSACVVARRETYVALCLAGFSTCQIADQTDVNQSAVYRGLRNSGIEIRKPGRRWTKEQLTALGKQRDKDIAELTGYSIASVGNKRRQLGIPSYKSRSSVNETAARDAKSMPLDEWCKRYGFSRAVYYAKRKQVK